MENLEGTIREHCTGLTSSRANERKKNAEAIKDLLSRNALGAFLSKNTLSNEVFTWNHLFDYTHDYILKEAENYQTSKTYQGTIGPLCASLLNLCVAGANKGKAYIKCDKIMSACLYILQDSNLTKAIGDAYLNLLYKHILPHNHYRANVTPGNWDELLHVCVSILHSNNSKLDQFTKLRLLWMVIKNGTSSCQFTLPLRDSLAKLKILRTFSDRKILEVAIDITTLLLEMLAPEYRLTMCEFTENILISLLQFYEPNIDQKKKSSLFRLMELTVLIHHPDGRYQIEDGSLAHDWTIWNKHLRNMLEIMCMEVSYLQKPIKQLDLSFGTCGQFYSMSATVYFQIFKLLEITDNTDVVNTPKRQRLLLNKIKRFPDLIQELEQNQIPWLGVILSYCNKYGSTIETCNYLLLMNTLNNFITNSINVIDWDSFTDIILLTVKKLSKRLDDMKKRNDDFLLLWNSCVRHSIAVNSLQKSTHKIMQLMLTTAELKFSNVQPLLKLYFDGSMPVNSHSVETLNKVLQKFVSKCGSFEERLNFFSWFGAGQLICVDAAPAREFILRVIVKDNINIVRDKTVSILNTEDGDNMHDIIFGSIEKSILFSEFEIPCNEYQKPIKDACLKENIEGYIDITTKIGEYLKTKTIELIQNLKEDSKHLPDFIIYIRIVLAYIDLLLYYKFVTEEEITKTELYPVLKTSLRLMYTSVNNALKSNCNNLFKIKLMKSVYDIFMSEYNSLLCIEVRRNIDEDFFHCANNIVNKENSPDEDLDNCDDESSLSALRCNCMLMLAAYCRKVANYRTEILEFVLDFKLYDLNLYWDVQCIFRCLELLSEHSVADPPLDEIFSVLMNMCRHMFRGSDETRRLLTILLSLLDRIWACDSIRPNCIIMVKGYLLRCRNLYYPPRVAALVYKCAARMIVLNRKQCVDRFDVNHFKKAVNDGTRKHSHCLRMYCIYTLKILLADYTDREIEEHLYNLTDIFNVEVPDNEELIVKDESANRTASLLHNFLALAQTKNILIHNIVSSILQIQKEKQLDENFVKKVLNIISQTITKEDISVHLNNNVLYFLNSWFLKKYDLNDLPTSFFGVENKQLFVRKHMRWLISAELLWAKNANIFNSDVLKETKRLLNKTDKVIFEECFCYFVVLCLPYVVNEKYNLEDATMMNPIYQQLRTNAKKLFQLTTQVLGNEKWSKLFEDNISELLFLAAKHLNDPQEAGIMFQLEFPHRTETYYYSKKTFSAILAYFGVLTEGNIMQYLCENQSVAILKTLFKLWDSVLKEYVFEFKAMSLHAFVTFVESIPLDHISDAFICNFVCNSLTQAIKDSTDKREVNVLTKALHTILRTYLPERVNHLRDASSHLLSILVIKKEEGFEEECSSLLSYLVEDLKDCLNDSEDVVDFINSLSQGNVENIVCSSYLQFRQKLKQHKESLKCPSHETLVNMHIFLTNNQKYVNDLCNEMDEKGFSENCDSSLIHQITYSLSCILTNTTDKKTIIEACNCLSKIGTYNLKTLVTVSSSNPSQITKMEPNSYFTTLVMKTLSSVLFEEGPKLTKKVAKALNHLLKYRDGVDALNREDVDEVKQILKPFESAEPNNVSNFQVNNSKFNSFNQSPNFWLPLRDEPHSAWLTRVTTTVLNILSLPTNYLNELQEVCTVKPIVCQKVLPSLIGLLLVCGNGQCDQAITTHINNFFKYIWDISFENKNENNSENSQNEKLSKVIDHDHKMIIQYVLSVVNFVRLQSCHYSQRRSRSALTLNYLNLEYDKVAWAATVANQNMAAIYYGELWTMAQNDRVPPASPEATTALVGGINIQRIFRKCFISVGSMDAVEGCGTAHLTSEFERRRHLSRTGGLPAALLLHDIAARHDCSSKRGLLRSLQKSGLFHLAVHHVNSLPEDERLNDIKYECLAALGDWSEVIDTRDLEEQVNAGTGNLKSIIKTFHYACLKDCLTLDASPNNDKLVVSVNKAKLAISRLCQDLDMENCQNVYKVIEKLHLFSDIEDYFAVRSRNQTMKDLLAKWQIENLPAFQDFKHVEDLISQRNLMLEHAAQEHKNEFRDILNLQLQYTEFGLENERVQLAQRFLSTAKKLGSTEEVALVESQIFWTQGHTDIALSLLRDTVLNNFNNFSNESLKAKSLRQYGLWMAESRCDSPKDIVKTYLKKSLDVLNNTRDEKTRLKLYNDIAKFSDAEYKKVVAYMNSPDFQNKEECVKKMHHNAMSRTQQPMSIEDQHEMKTNQKYMHLEQADIASTKDEKEIFLHSAMRYYLLSLAQSEENNLSIFRVISLWLENAALESLEGQPLQRLLGRVPSRKFVSALPQLAPRLSADSGEFADNLRLIIERCAKEHPHHTLPILFSLKNSDKDMCILNSSASSAHAPRTQEPRVSAAHDMVASLALDPKLSTTIKQMEKLCDATISFANYAVRTKTRRQDIPSEENIHKLSRLNAVPIPTVTIPIRHDCNYDDVPTLMSFDNYFELVGGINCPKKINCLGSDGIRRILLVKGKDDLRQDAVVQQVFNIVNTLLEKNVVTSRSKLLIRTYKVVPLSKRSGVLEWCGGTVPIGLYLVGVAGQQARGAHARYRPQDLSCDAARSALSECQQATNEKKLQVFNKILQALKPVFHYFFTEHYLDPVSWYERRQTYTKSVAASSMVGYVMGLADRHVQNILIDKQSAEVIHIDFGYAFDHGKILRTPETVPFRLTQDIIAGFGSSGVEGVFRRCCEKTMQLLRDNQETLLSILEVLLYDPLYSLTSSRQTSDGNALGGDSGHPLAARALLSVRSKLSGAEGGAAQGVAVRGQVARLLRQATDPANLCRLFPGWQPYL